MGPAEARRSLEILFDTLETQGYRGWDPYDALSSPFVRRVARTRFLRQLAIQTLKRSPVNLRPLLGVPRRDHAMGLALLLSAAARAGDVARVERLATNLADKASHRPEGVGWGYDFDVQTRWGFYRGGRPNAVVTSFATHALLDARDAGVAHHAPLASRAADYVAESLVTAGGFGRFVAYHEGGDTLIHNANLLGAGVLRRLAGEAPERRRLADELLATTVRRQAQDGSWPYGAARGLEWVDGYHTAFVLLALDEWRDDPGAARALERGLAYYMRSLFDPDGAPRATSESRYPIDVHGAAFAVIALARLARVDPNASSLRERVMDWSMENLARRDGRFRFQIHRHHRSSIPYVRWSDAPMALALAVTAQAGNAR